MVKSHEEQFETFISLAQSWGMDVEIHPILNKYFQDHGTQDCWMTFTHAYWKGVFDADIERREKGIYYV